MKVRIRARAALLAAAASLMFSAAAGNALSADVGQIKTVKGTVHVERGGQRIPATVGAGVRQTDTVVTGADGAIGITFDDNTLMSAGPNSVLSIDRFVFDPTTHKGAFDSTLKKGTLSVVSGKIAKESPDAMKVNAPAAILGVRGTEFFVQAREPGGR